MPDRCASASSETSAEKPGAFPATHWSVVITARGGEETQAMAALETLCRTYQYPLCAFVRRQGYSPEDAQDFTQGFFTRLLEEDYPAGLGPAKGRFCSFLLTALKCFLADEHDKATAQKRGGGWTQISLDALTAEERYQLEPAQNWMPEKLFDRQSALTVHSQPNCDVK